MNLHDCCGNSCGFILILIVIHCVPKKKIITRAILVKFGTVSSINLLQNDLNIFYLTWIMSLFCDTWNAHCARATIELLQKETPEFKYPTLTASSNFQIRQIQQIHHFAANLFRKRCAKFLSELPEFCRRYYNRHFGLFFWTHCMLGSCHRLVRF